MMPACDHTGTPRHFHSSTTSGSACLMTARTRASVSPLQSLSSLILASISREGESAPVASFAPLVVFFAAGVAFFMDGLSHAFAGQLAGLLHPVDELSFVEAVLADIEVAYVLVLGLAEWHRTQRRAAEEGHFDILREAMKAEEPDMVLDSIEGRVPFDRLAHAGDAADDQRVEAAPDVAFPARHGRDVGLHGSIAIGLRDLRVATGEEGRVGRRRWMFALG